MLHGLEHASFDMDMQHGHGHGYNMDMNLQYGHETAVGKWIRCLDFVIQH